MRDRRHSGATEEKGEGRREGREGGGGWAGGWQGLSERHVSPDAVLQADWLARKQAYR
jgi:hypothetical protein